MKQRIFYGVQIFIPVLLLRTFRFPEIRTCETTDELGCVIGSVNIQGDPRLGTSGSCVEYLSGNKPRTKTKNTTEFLNIRS